MSAADLEACIAAGGVAVFPADTVYGLACDPESADAVARLYALKGRPPAQAAAVMFFALEAALAALPELGPRTRAAFEALLPGGVTLLVPNPERRYPLAGREDPRTLGVRVPALPAFRRGRAPGAPVERQPRGRARRPAARRRARGHPPRRRPRARRGRAPGTPSTVLDLRRYDDAGTWEVLREGAVPAAQLAAALA